MISLLDRKIQTFRVQNGDLEHPARSCREIKLDHPESKSGLLLKRLLTSFLCIYVARAIIRFLRDVIEWLS